MKAMDTSSLDLFGEARTDMQTSSQSKRAKSRSSNAKKNQTEFQLSNYTVGRRSRSTVQDSYCCKMASDDMHLPCGLYQGALPNKIVIKGVHLRYSATSIINGETYDRLINTVTGKKMIVERNKLLNFLIKNGYK